MTACRFLLVMALLVLPAPLRAQCAMCRQAAATSPEGQRLAPALGRGVVLLVSAPFALLAVGAAVLFRTELQRPLRRLRQRVR